MKKKLTMALLTAGIMAMICTGCGNKKDSGNKDSGKDTKVTTTQSDRNEETEVTDETEKDKTVDKSNKDDSDLGNIIRQRLIIIYHICIIIVIH